MQIVTSAADEIRVGLIGYGLAGRAFHAPLIASVPGMRLAAIVTRDPERVAHARAGHPAARIVDSAERLWEHGGELDLVVVASPNRLHVPHARAALHARLPVVVDKPFAPTAAEARALVDEARGLGLLLTVFQNRRWDGDFLTVRRLMAEGALGDVHRFESRFERWRPVPKGGWREEGDPAEAGGILYDLGSHLIDQALVLFGPVTHVYAEVDRRRPGVRVDDDAFVALTHASGVRSHLWMSAVAGDHALRMRVLGSRAAYVKRGMDVQEAALRDGALPGPGWGPEPEDDWGRLGAAQEWTRVPTEPGAWPAFYAAVAHALRTGAPPPVDPLDSVAGLEIIHAARQSAMAAGVIPVIANPAPASLIPCPVCGQGVVHPVRLNALGTTAWLCDECDALWQARAEIAHDGWTHFEAFMRSHGRPGLWSEVTLLDGGFVPGQFRK